jgi:outer membrane receptor protein involved in Fe transport
VDLSLPYTQDAPTFSDPCTGLTDAKVAATPNLAIACQGVPRDGTFVQPQSQITGLITGSQDLKPEEGDVTTAGIVYDVSQVGGLSFSLDYWRYKLNDLITNLDPNFAVNQCVLTGNPDFCDLMVRYDATSPNAGEFQVFREPIVNLGKLKTDGFDFGVKYAIRDTPVGSFNTTLDITRINSYENTPAPGADPIEIAGTFDRQFGNYAKYRGNLGVGWNMFGVDALLTVRYIHNIELKEADGCLPNCPGGATDPNPTVSIPSFTYFDLTVGYTLPTKTRIQAGVINLGDKDPPILYQNNVLNANTDVSTYDTLGRRWFVGVTQKF